MSSYFARRQILSYSRLFIHVAVVSIRCRFLTLLSRWQVHELVGGIRGLLEALMASFSAVARLPTRYPAEATLYSSWCFTQHGEITVELD